MYSKRRTYNPNRHVASKTVQAELDKLAAKVRYRGNPEHKRNPGDFALAPPLGPRPGKTLCDEAGIFNKAVAQRLLREGIRRGLVSRQGGAGYPKNIWAVSDEGFPMEAQLENSGDGSYHGYPMPEDDAFREIVIEKWNATHD
jgi:hypothetical protein